MALNAYLQQVQRLIGDVKQAAFNPSDLISYINQARGQVAAEGQCIRAIPPIASSIATITVQSAGAGYIAPSIVIAAPDSPSGFLPFPNGNQAFAVAAFSGGKITAITMTSGGAGYFSPTIAINDSAGVGAVAVANIGPVNATVAGQEVYAFADVNFLVATPDSGISSIYFVNSISMIWGTFRYTLMRNSFSKYQALVRNYTAGYQFIPAVFAQFGQGVDGSVYVYPIPNTTYQMEWDCCCLPTDLCCDTDPEAIPYPWTDAVPYYAAYVALDTVQTAEGAARAQARYKQFEMYMQRARRMSQPRGVVNWYGRA